MKTEKEIKARIKEVEESYCHILKGDMATIDVNAVRALMQIQTISLLDGLYFAIGKKRPQYEFEKAR